MTSSETPEKYDFITVEELAKMLRLNRMTAYRLVNARKIRHYRIGDNIRIRRQDALEFIENSVVNPNEANE